MWEWIIFHVDKVYIMINFPIYRNFILITEICEEKLGKKVSFCEGMNEQERLRKIFLWIKWTGCNFMDELMEEIDENSVNSIHVMLIKLIYDEDVGR